jgi:hypothetical protein
MDSPLGLSSVRRISSPTNRRRDGGALRTAYEIVTGGAAFRQPACQAVAGWTASRHAEIKIEGQAAECRSGGGDVESGGGAPGLGNARKVIGRSSGGQAEYHFIEVMTSRRLHSGGGASRGRTNDNVRKRASRPSTGEDVREEAAQVAREPDIIEGPMKSFSVTARGASHKLLHTHYHPQGVVK